MKIRNLIVLFLALGFAKPSSASCTIDEFNGNTTVCINPSTYQTVWLHVTMFPAGQCVGTFSVSMQYRDGGGSWIGFVPNVSLFSDVGLPNQSSFNDVAKTTQLAGTARDYRAIVTYNPSGPVGACQTQANEVCTTSVLSINVKANAVADFKINGNTTSPTTAMQVYGNGCSGQAFTFNNLAAGGLTGAQHKLYWKEANSSGTVIGSTFGNTTWTTGSYGAGSIDMKTYSGGHLGSVGALGKYWLIYFEVGNECVASNIKTALVYVNSAPSAPAGAFVVNIGNGGTPCASSSQASPCIVCAGYTPTFTVTSTTGTITSYTKKVDRWTGSTWVNEYTSATLIPPGGGLTSMGAVFMAPASFSPNSTDVYRFTLTITNQCGTSSPLLHYFKANLACRLGSSLTNSANDKLKITPNPSNGLFTITTEDAEDKISSVKVIDLTGKTVLLIENMIDAIGTAQIDGTSFNNGIYIVETVTASGTYKTQLSVQK